MPLSAVSRRRIAPQASTTSLVAELLVDERHFDAPGIAIPRPEAHLVVRFGPAARTGVDVHAFGPRQRVHRKFILSGQRTVTARLRLGAHEAVLGAPASAISERIVPLEELWGEAQARRLFERLAAARATVDAAAVLDSAIAERLALAADRRAGVPLALHAAERLAHANVKAVSIELGVSDRHLRRVFHESFGLNPKVFAQLARFRRALHAARADHEPNWAGIASAAGYYDQAHLIADFRAIAGVTPRALLDELKSALSVG
ncbi:MAG TPA: helix-turn-helix domain-containing protein [Polyangiaceae bacterium]|nr:helix-turn-helix domain-containing protein [Polyangiaceae bacterium]